MGTRSLFVAAMFCTLMLSASGFAAPVAYIEGADLSHPSVGTPLTTFTLDVGVNTVSGTITATSDFDSFAFIVPAGMQVTAGDLTIGDVSGNLGAAKWTLFQGSDLSGTGTNLGIVAANSPAFPTTNTVLFNAGSAPVLSLIHI